jgi:hypothetical protein
MNPSRRKPSKFLISLLYALLELPLPSPDRRRYYTPGPPACIALREKYWKSSDLDTVWEVPTPACRYSRISELVWGTSLSRTMKRMENGRRFDSALSTTHQRNLNPSNRSKTKLATLLIQPASSSYSSASATLSSRVSYLVDSIVATCPAIVSSVRKSHLFAEVVLRLSIKTWYGIAERAQVKFF